MTEFILKVLPRLTSATRLVLLLLIIALVYMSIRAMSIPAEFKDVLMIVVSFYFGQRATEVAKPITQP